MSCMTRDTTMKVIAHYCHPWQWSVNGCWGRFADVTNLQISDMLWLKLFGKAVDDSPIAALCVAVRSDLHEKHWG